MTANRAQSFHSRFLPVWYFGLAAISLPVTAAPIKLESPEEQVSLLELYTSEGCSSCPPAEAWFTGLRKSPQLWRNFVPVAFHVDYWDSLGWKDPFGSKAYSERQHDHAQHWRNQSIYTPGFVLNGKEWRGWFNRETLPSTTSNRRVGMLRAQSLDGHAWTLEFHAADPPAHGGFEFHTALLRSEERRVGKECRSRWSPYH